MAAHLQTRGRAMTDGEIRVEIVFASPDTQSLLEIRLKVGTSVRRALELSGIYEKFGNVDMTNLHVGIWGQLVGRDRIVENGDRIELYRALEIDPREARRRLAESGRTMGQPNIE
jgi:putative ubiquitin-RnfH superfamily antitoxin RatB of RatAB toxin-antitoxin module